MASSRQWIQPILQAFVTLMSIIAWLSTKSIVVSWSGCFRVSDVGEGDEAFGEDFDPIDSFHQFLAIFLGGMLENLSHDVAEVTVDDKVTALC